MKQCLRTGLDQSRISINPEICTLQESFVVYEKRETDRFSINRRALIDAHTPSETLNSPLKNND